MAIVLNILSGVIVARFVYLLHQVHRRTHFLDVNFEMAMKMSIMGPGLVHRSELMILAISNLPLLVGFHVPPNSDVALMHATDGDLWILGQVVAERTLWYFSQLMVAISLTWFIRLGIELGRSAVKLQTRPSAWYTTLCMSWCQYIFLVPVFIVRSFLAPIDQGYNQAAVVLVVSCGFSICVGFIAAFAVTHFSHTIPSDRLTTLDRVFALRHIPRSFIGSLAQSCDGWHLSGMLLEGWHIVGNTLDVGFGQSLLFEDQIARYVESFAKLESPVIETKQ
jgi:hypothetical protein